MVNSTLNGSAGAKPTHRKHRTRAHTADVPASGLLPSKTQGSTGSKDQGDPNHTSLLGWTPNLTGFRDWGDHTLHEMQHLWHKTLGAIGLEKESGAPVSNGAAASAAPAGTLTLDETHLLALRIATVFEGTGGKSMDYVALAGDFDNMATSFGLIQWNFGSKSLGPLLSKFLAADATAFDQCFPADANLATLKTALAARNIDDQSQWARDLYSTPAGKRAWTRSFENLGAVEKFKKMQFDIAIADYNPTVIKDVAYLRKQAPKLMDKVEFRSYAALFDCSVQQGGLAKAEPAITALIASEKPATQFALLTLALTARANAANPVSVADCLNRRLSILNGKRMSFTAHGKTYNRDNSQYGLVLTHGTKTIEGV